MPDRKPDTDKEGTLVQIDYGIINTPSANVADQGNTLTLDTRDYYFDRLVNKQTGDSYIWSFDHIKPIDILRALIGAKFIVQEMFKDQRRLDNANMNNTCLVNQALQLVPNGVGTYPVYGYVQSTTLQNSTDFNSMGQINDIDVTLTGSPAVAASSPILSTAA